MCRLGSRHEPFCTVLLQQMSESIGVLKEQLGRQTRRPGLPSRNRADPNTETVCPAAPVVFTKLQSTAGCVRISSTSSGAAHGEVMFLASKIGSARIALTLLTTAMLVQGFPRSAAGSDSNKDGVVVFVVKNEIKKMQETLRNKGHYRGKVDGVFGLQTRDSIREYQKAENLPITGQVDTRTAAELGVRPESTWANSKSTGREVGPGSDIVGSEINKDKPSAGIRRAEGRASKTSRKEASRAIAIEDNRGDGVNNQRAENEKHDR